MQRSQLCGVLHPWAVHCQPAAGRLLPSGLQVHVRPLTIKSSYRNVVLFFILLHAFPARRGKMRPADKLQVKAAKFLPLVGLARSKQDPINQPWARCSVFISPPASRGPNRNVCGPIIGAWNTYVVLYFTTFPEKFVIASTHIRGGVALLRLLAPCRGKGQKHLGALS